MTRVRSAPPSSTTTPSRSARPAFSHIADTPTSRSSSLILLAPAARCAGELSPSLTSYPTPCPLRHPRRADVGICRCGGKTPSPALATDVMVACESETATEAPLVEEFDKSLDIALTVFR